jgi:RNA polymerase sigma-70 factor (ECF subfamily)
MLDTSVSLLERLRTQADAVSWQRLVALYTPLLQSWLRRNGVTDNDVDDLVQEVLATLARELPNFHYDPERGSFRGWLYMITMNRLRMFWRSRRAIPLATGDSGFAKSLDELEDPQSASSSLWDCEHDRHVVRQLLIMLQPEFEAATWRAFQLVALEGIEATAVAAELGISLNAVYLAKYRVLRRLRHEIRGLSD